MAHPTRPGTDVKTTVESGETGTGLGTADQRAAAPATGPIFEPFAAPEAALPAEAMPVATPERSFAALVGTGKSAKRAAGIPGGIDGDGGNGDGGEGGRKGVEKPLEDTSAIARIAQFLGHKPGEITDLMATRPQAQLTILTFADLGKAKAAYSILQGSAGSMPLQILDRTVGGGSVYQVVLLSNELDTPNLGQQASATVSNEVYFNETGFYGHGVSSARESKFAGKQRPVAIIPPDDQYKVDEIFMEEPKEGEPTKADQLNALLKERESRRQKDPDLTPHFQGKNPIARIEELKDGNKHFCALISIEGENERSGRDQKEIVELAERYGLIVAPMISGEPITIIEPSERGGTLALFAQALNQLSINRTHTEPALPRLKIAIAEGEIEVLGNQGKTLVPNNLTKRLTNIAASARGGEILMDDNARQLVQERDANVKLIFEQKDGYARITKVESSDFLDRARPKVYVPTALREDVGTFLASDQKTLVIEGDAGSGKSATTAEALTEFKRANQGRVIILSATGVDKADLGEIRMYAQSMIRGLLEISKTNAEAWGQIKSTCGTDIRYILDFHNNNQKDDYELDLETLGAACDAVERDLKTIGITTVKVGDDIRRFGDEAHSWFQTRAKNGEGKIVYTHRKLAEREGRDIEADTRLEALPVLITNSEGQPAPMVTQWIAAVHNNGTIEEGSEKYASTASPEVIQYITAVVNGQNSDAGARVNPLRAVRAIRAMRNLGVVKTDKTGVLTLNITEAEAKREEVMQAANLSEITTREFANIMGRPAGENPATIVALEGLNLEHIRELANALRGSLNNISLDIVEQCIAVGIIEVDNNELVINSRWKELLATEASSQKLSPANANALYTQLSQLNQRPLERGNALTPVSAVVLYRLAQRANNEDGKKQYLMPAARVAIERGDYEEAISVVTEAGSSVPVGQKPEIGLILAQAYTFAGRNGAEAKTTLEALLKNPALRLEAAKTLLQLGATAGLVDRKNELKSFGASLVNIRSLREVASALSRELDIYTAIHKFLSDLSTPEIPYEKLDTTNGMLEKLAAGLSYDLENTQHTPKERNHLLSLLALATSTQQRVQSELARKSGDTNLSEAQIKAVIAANPRGASANAFSASKSLGERALHLSARARGFNSGGKLQAQIVTNMIRANLFLGNFGGDMERTLSQAEAQFATCKDPEFTALLRAQLVPPVLEAIKEMRETPDAHTGDLGRLTQFYFDQCKASYGAIQHILEGSTATTGELTEIQAAAALNYAESLVLQALWSKQEDTLHPGAYSGPSAETRSAIAATIKEDPKELAKAAGAILKLFRPRLSPDLAKAYQPDIEDLTSKIEEALR